jgi:hypothetical protein
LAEDNLRVILAGLVLVAVGWVIDRHRDRRRATLRDMSDT